MFFPNPGKATRFLTVFFGIILFGGSLSACLPGGDTSSGAPQTIRVPEDAPTPSEGMAKLREGDTLEIGEGVFKDTITVNVPNVTIRGVDRNKSVLDGEGRRENGILVIADGVRVENLTIKSYLYNGVLVTGLHDGNRGLARGSSGYEKLDPEKYPPIQRYAVSYVTAYNNGLYGIYVFNAQKGRINDNYTSGSADSGIYIGQCRDCNSLISGNIAENNAVGFQNANASDEVYIVQNRFSNNRVGLTLTSNYQEAFTPQKSNVVAGNVISDNNEPQVPAQADGAFGVGIGISGGVDNRIERNRVSGNQQAGVLIRNTEDLPAMSNRLIDNLINANGVDVADVASSRAVSQGNCISGSDSASFLPPGLKDLKCLQSSGPAGPFQGADPSALPVLKVPAGVSFLKIQAPPAQPNAPERDSSQLPESIQAPDITAIQLPPLDLLAGLSRK